MTIIPKHVVDSLPKLPLLKRGSEPAIVTITIPVVPREPSDSIDALALRLCPSLRRTP